MPFLATLKNLIRRNPNAPSLREHAAELSGSLSRRTVVAGSFAAAVPLPALALAAPTVLPVEPHPDQALLDAEAEYLRATAACEAARQASRDASSAFNSAFGSYPEELFLEGWERHLFAGITRHTVIGQVPTQAVWREHCTNAADLVWTAEGLRRVIRNAVPAFGRGGQTPHMVRRWKGLLPLAEAWDARRADLKLRFRCKELSDAYRAAEKTANRATLQVHRIPAMTVEGLAVHTRRLASTAWYEGNTTYTALLLSAAAITGVTLRQSDFDVPAWMAAWERVGGRVEWRADDEEWAYICPSVPMDAPCELKDEVSRLTQERGSNSAVIYRWLEARR
ncbi:hypothetical protein [Methylobacterium longum]|uniref:Uncharacterized protein n=1 Tax=Methylobacterium longum TaxID=767694 RepID=A0ABT8AU65_9HYPH|nr:hypothetical protein [Methylobacterium longum]MDN3572956.1 hypothetical protein [Methylobacterium longum]GJE14561.1 hypothetical protein FOHLNKBM_5636 [Methylobacterium longum]